MYTLKNPAISSSLISVYQQDQLKNQITKEPVKIDIAVTPTIELKAIDS